MAKTWKAAPELFALANEIKEKYYLPRLEQASIAVALVDGKPFIKNRFNWGNVVKFSDFNRIWQQQEYDFCISIIGDVWYDVLDQNQREALIDLHLTRCSVEYEPEVVIEGKKKKVIKDDLGRVQYTNNMKCDEEGRPKWMVLPMDLTVFASNVRRYGLWCEDLNDFESAVRSK